MLHFTGGITEFQATRCALAGAIVANSVYFKFPKLKERRQHKQAKRGVIIARVECCMYVCMDASICTRVAHASGINICTSKSAARRSDPVLARVQEVLPDVQHFVFVYVNC